MSTGDLTQTITEFVLTRGAVDSAPAGVRRRVRWLVCDALTSAVYGRATGAARLAADGASSLYASGQSTLLADGRVAHPVGAAWANGVLANAVDIDDGHRLTKGHPGAAVVPAALAVAEHVNASRSDLLDAVLVGYEVAIRAGIAQHARAAAYYASGSWVALGAAAASARLLGLGADAVRQALGLAEYHAPMALMLRSTNDPAMTKDAIGQGARVGVSSAFEAAEGFTSVRPVVLVEPLFDDLGQRWRAADCYVKAFPCCRWTQAALVLARTLREEIGDVDDVDRVTIHAFAAAGELAQRPRPRTTEEAQYSLIWPVARMLTTGRFAVEDLEADALADPATERLAARIDVVEDPDLEAEFPARTLSRMDIGLRDGRVICGGPTEPPGDAEHPRWEAIVADKIADVRERLADGSSPADALIRDLLDAFRPE